ncbi:MAG: hypothetical protein JNL16_08515 [Dechloromonas sp.]|nr:hypothetical protein [Dechloromonas sp.]
MGHANPPAPAGVYEKLLFFSGLRFVFGGPLDSALFVDCCSMEHLFQNGATAMKLAYLFVLAILVAPIAAR